MRARKAITINGGYAGEKWSIAVWAENNIVRRLWAITKCEYKEATINTTGARTARRPHQQQRRGIISIRTRTLASAISVRPDIKQIESAVAGKRGNASPHYARLFAWPPACYFSAFTRREGKSIAIEPKS